MRNSKRTDVSDQVGRWEGEGGAPMHPGRMAEGESTDHRFERIRRRAYELYESRCRDQSPGDEQGDWSAAEREIDGAQAFEPQARLAT